MFNKLRKLILRARSVKSLNMAARDLIASSIRRKYSISELDKFVHDVDVKGGVASPNAAEVVRKFELDISYDEFSKLDPFSEEYIAKQISVYNGISGRLLNQDVNEHTAVPDNRHAANPYGSGDIAFIAKHSRTIQNMVMLADLKPGAHVLDMGAGWGLSTENIAFTGAKVTAVDVNRDFVDLIRYRAERRNYDVMAIASSFDDFSLNDKVDAIFFYECLHHCSDVVKLLKKCGEYLKADGKIIFAGEPVTSAWWGRGHWGMRLDAESAYVMRKFGWFETGWSEEFIRSAFERAGFRLKLIAGIGLDHGYIGYASRVENYTDAALMSAISLVAPPHWPAVS